MRVRILDNNEQLISTLEGVGNFTYQPEVNKAGTWSFTYPAWGIYAAYLIPTYRIQVNDHSGQFIVAGEITGVRRVSSQGRYVLEVKGWDQLNDLRYQLTGAKVLTEIQTVTAPNNPYYYLQTVDDANNTTFNEETLPVNFQLDYRDFIYFGAPTPIRKVTLTIGPGNGTQVVSFDDVLYQHYTGTFNGWDRLKGVTDTTRVGNRPFAQSGEITWDLAWFEEYKTPHYERDIYWYRIGFPLMPSDDRVDFTVTGLTYELDGPLGNDVAEILSGTGWSLGAGFAGTEEGTYQQFYGETILKALNMLAEEHNEFFVLAGDKTISWLRKGEGDSIQVDANASEGRPFIADISIDYRGPEFTRLYVVGSGNSEAITSMDGADTGILPPGYTVGSETWELSEVYYVANTDLEIDYGQRKRFMQASEFNSVRASGNSPQLATQLLQNAFYELQQVDTIVRTMSCTLLNRSEFIRPRTKIEVTDTIFENGVDVADVKREWLIERVRYRFTNNRLTVGLDCTDTNNARPNKSTVEVLRNTIDRVRRSQLNRPAIHYRDLTNAQGTAGGAIGSGASDRESGLAGSMIWRGFYTGNEQFRANDVTRDGEWLMIANRATFDRPGPQPVASFPSWNIDDDTSWTFVGGQGFIATGLQVSSVAGSRLFKAFQARFNAGLATDVRYVLAIYVQDTTGGLYSPRFYYEAPSPSLGWNETGAFSEANLVLPGSSIRIALLTESTLGEATINGRYNVFQAAGTPGTGEIYGSTTNTLSINETDLDSLTFDLLALGMEPGDGIRITETAQSTRYTLYQVTGTPIDQGSYQNVAVAVQDQGGAIRNGRECTVAFTLRNPTGATGYNHVPLGIPPELADLNAKGFVTTNINDLTDPNLTLNDDLYGVDLLTQEYTLSPDFDIMSITSV